MRVSSQKRLRFRRGAAHLGFALGLFLSFVGMARAETRAETPAETPAETIASETRLSTRDTAMALDPYSLLLLKGRQALKAQRPMRAAMFFAKARRIAPTDPEPQVLFAEALSRAGQNKRAEAFLVHLLNDPDQKQNAPYYLSGLDTFEKRSPFRVGASAAILPSTNIYSASSQTVFDTLLGRFDIEDGGQEKSGLGANIGVTGQFRHPLGEGAGIDVSVLLQRRWYEDPSLRYWRGRLAADFKKRAAQRNWRVGLHVDRIYYADVDGTSSDRITTGIHGSWQQSLEASKIGLSGFLEQRSYLEKETLSGPYASLGMKWSKRLDNAVTVKLGGTLERGYPELDYHRYWGAGLSFAVEKTLWSNLRTGAHASYSLRQYDHDFSAVDYKRRDDIFRLGFSLSDSRIKVMGSTPKLSCTYKEQHSNIALYDMTTTDCQLSWAYQF